MSAAIRLSGIQNGTPFSFIVCKAGETIRSGVFQKIVLFIWGKMMYNKKSIHRLLSRGINCSRGDEIWVGS